MALDITTLASTDKLSDSRGDINTNFTNIKTDCALIDQSMYIGTTAVAINRTSATLNLAGIGTLVCGAITATSYDGVLAANLLDKSATEEITGAWTFPSNVQFAAVSGTHLDLVSSATNSDCYIKGEGQLAGVSKIWYIGYDYSGSDFVIGQSSGLATCQIHINTNGEILLKPAGTLALTLDSSQNATFAGTLACGAITTSADMIMGTHKITGLRDPVADQDAATKKYTDELAEHKFGTQYGQKVFFYTTNATNETYDLVTCYASGNCGFAARITVIGVAVGGEKSMLETFLVSAGHDATPQWLNKNTIRIEDAKVGLPSGNSVSWVDTDTTTSILKININELYIGTYVKVELSKRHSNGSDSFTFF